MGDIKKIIKNLCKDQLFAVLATVHENKPYTSIVAFALTDDLKKLVFITPRDTRKFQYLQNNSFVSFLVNNSNNRSADIAEAIGATITGTASEVKGMERTELLKIFIAKHPQMEEFAISQSSALISVRVKRYDVVEKFQEVTHIHMED